VRVTVLALAGELARGALRELETHVDALVQEDQKLLWLYPALVDLARQRGDLEAALSYLRRLRELGIASKSRTAGTSIGGVSETVALDAEIGSLLFELGRVDEAREVWSTLFSEEDLDDNRGVLATLYELHELHEDARAHLLELLEDQDGTQKVPTLRRLAELDVEAGDIDSAIARATMAEVLSGHSLEQRLYLSNLHRKRGTLRAYFDELVAASAKDPDDDALAKVVVQLAIELEQDEVAVATVERMVDKPDQAKILQPYLIRMKLLRGDEDGALLVYEELLEGNIDEWRRQQYGTQLARALAKKGELERAEAVLRRSYPDPDGYEAMLAIARQLVELERWEEALADAEQAITLDPKGWEACALAVDMEVELGSGREAFDRLYALLDDPALAGALGSGTRAARELAEDLGELERLRAEREAAPDDPRAAKRLGMLLTWLGRDEEALEPLEAARAGLPPDEVLLANLARIYELVERYDAAEQALLELIALRDRERNLEREGWSADGEIQGSVDELRRLYLLRGDVDAALQVGERRLGTRYQEVNSYSFSYTSNPFQRSWNLLYWLQNHGFHQEYVEQQRFLAVFDRWNRRNYEHTAFEMRYRGGDESAPEELWQAILEPGRSLVGKSNDNRYTYYTTSASANYDARTLTLVRLFREQGRLDELIGRVEAELAVHPEDPVMRPLLGSILREEERWEDVLRFAREDLEESPDDAARKNQVASILMHLERWEEALPILEDVYRSQVADVPTSSGQYWTAVRVGGGDSKRGSLGKVRFAWSGSYTGSSSSYSYFTSGGDLDLQVDPQEEQARQSLMVVYSALGRADDARRLERVARSMEVLETWGSGAVLELLRVYASHRRVEECERVAAEALAEDEEEYELSVFETMCALYREVGDEAKRLAWAARWRARIDRELAEDPDSREWLERGARLAFEQQGDTAAALAYLGRSPGTRPSAYRSRLEGWADLAAGEPARARECFEESERLGWIEGTPPDGDLLYGRGFALAAMQDAWSARPILLRALAMDSDSRHALRAEELLQ